MNVCTEPHTSAAGLKLGDFDKFIINQPSAWRSVKPVLALEMEIKLKKESNDNPQFLSIIESIISGTVAVNSLEHYAVVKIDNWFDDKWAGFHGVFKDYSGFSEFGNKSDIPRTYIDTKTLPPFTRSRVQNIVIFGKPNENIAGVFYYSGNSQTNARGSILSSIPKDSDRWDWYVGFSGATNWKAVRYKNIGRAEINQLTRIKS